MPSSPDAGVRRRWQAHFDEAHSLLERGKTGPAAERAREAIRIDPGNGHAHFLLGLALERAKRHDEALAALAEALELARGDARLLAQVRLERSHIRLEQGRPDLAVAEAREAAGLGAEPGPAALALAAACRGAGRPDEALAELDRALGLCGGDPRLSARIRGEKAHILFAQEKYEPAIAEFRAAAEAGERSGDADLLLGLACKHAGRLEEALAAFAEALRSAAGDRKLGWRIRFESAHILLDQGRPGPAAEQAREALRLDDGTGHAHHLLGLALERQGRRGEALTAFAAALEHAREDGPLRAQVLCERADILSKEGRDGEALADLDAALRLCGPDPGLRGRIHGKRADILFTQGGYEAAIAAFREAAAAGERSANAAFLLGLALERSGRRDEALAELAAAAALAAEAPPLRARIHEARADILFAAGETERSLSESAQAAALSPDAGRAAFALGSAYQRAGRREPALRELERAAGAYGGDRGLLAQVREARAHIFFEQGDYASCRDELQAAAGLGRESAATAFLLALACKHTGRGDEALAAFGQALKLPGADAALRRQALYERARMHFEAGRWEAARDGFSEALALGLDTGEVRLMLGRSHEKLGALALAERELARGAQAAPSRQALLELIQVRTRLKKPDSCAEACVRFLELEAEHDAAENRAYLDRLEALGRRRPAGQLKVKLLQTTFYAAPGPALNFSLLPPLGLANIAAYLRGNGIPLDLDDLHIRVNLRNAFGGGEPIPMEVFCDRERVLAYSRGGADPELDAILDRVEELSPCAGYDAVLLSLIGDAVNPSEALFTLALAHRLKKKHGPLIVAGGKLRAVDGLLGFDTPDIDHIGWDKGEKLLFLLLAAAERGLDVAGIPGTPLQVSGKVLRTDSFRGWVDPDYQGLPMELYAYRSPREFRSVDPEVDALLRGFARSGVTMSQHRLMEGCFFGCIFCGSSLTQEVLILPPRRAVDQLRRLREDYGLRCFFFLNRMINFSRRYVNEFCDELLRADLDILWSDSARPDHMDRDTLLKMRRTGCVRLIYGLESANPRVSRLIDKKIDLGRLGDILRWTDEAGILTGLEVISGFPRETLAEAQDTVDFLLRHREHIDLLYCTSLHLLKNSRLFQDPEKFGITNIAQAGPEDNVPLGSPPTLRFDEVGGRRWEDRCREVGEIYRQVLERTREVGVRLPHFEAEPLIFHLYSLYDDKRKIVSLLKRAAAAL